MVTSDIERIFREEYGRAVSVLVRVCGDIDTAEEAVQDAFTTALEWGLRYARATRLPIEVRPFQGKSTS